MGLLGSGTWTGGTERQTLSYQGVEGSTDSSSCEDGVEEGTYPRYGRDIFVRL